MANELHTLKIGNTSYPVVPQQVYLTGKADNVNYPLVFATAIGSSTAGSASNQTLLTDTANSLYYNPSTNALTASKFIGALEGKASSAAVADSAGTASSVAWTGVTGKPTTFTPSEHTHSYLPLSGGTLTGGVNVYTPLVIKSTNLSEVWMQFQDSTGTTHIGSAKGVPSINSGSGNQTLLHSGNIGSYNAGSATKLQTARTIWGQSFDGTGDVSGGMFLNRYNASGNTAGADIVINKSTDFFGMGASSSDVSNFSFGLTSNLQGTWKSEFLTITNVGNVLIGTTTDNGAKLQVNGDVKAKRDFTIDRYGDHTYWANGYYIRGEEGTSWGIGAYSNDKATEYYYIGGYGSEMITIRPNGNVGIGTTSPSEKLSVDGNITATGTVTAPTFNGNLNGSASKVNGYSVAVVTSMPSSPDANTIYYVVENGYPGQ